MAEQVDCLDGKAVLSYLPYNQHISVRFGEFARDWMLTVLKERKYDKEAMKESFNRLLDEVEEKTGERLIDCKDELALERYAHDRLEHPEDY
jgi:hypothetical protein